MRGGGVRGIRVSKDDELLVLPKPFFRPTTCSRPRKSRRGFCARPKRPKRRHLSSEGLGGAIWAHEYVE